MSAAHNQAAESDPAVRDDEIAAVAKAAVAAAKATGDRAHDDADRAHTDATAPTNHQTPCPSLLTHIAEVVRMATHVGALRAYLISATVGVLAAIITAGGFFLTRDDTLLDRMLAADKAQADAGQAREVAIGIIQARMAASEVASAAATARTDNTLGKLEGKLDALAAQVATLSRQQPQPQYTVP